jgi:hypothetical protein
VQNLERALFYIKRSEAGRYRVRADILGVKPDPNDPETTSLEKP